jgi:hypothetical protein
LKVIYDKDTDTLSIILRPGNAAESDEARRRVADQGREPFGAASPPEDKKISLTVADRHAYCPSSPPPRMR